MLAICTNIYIITKFYYIPKSVNSKTIYDLAGRRASNAARGVNKVNGRNVIYYRRAPCCTLNCISATT